MNSELKFLQDKYAINLFSWYNFKSLETELEEDSSILIIGDCDENLVTPISERVKSVDLFVSTEKCKKELLYQVLSKNVKLLNQYVNGEKFSEYDEEVEKENNSLIKKLKEKYDYIIIPSLTKDILSSFSCSNIKEFLVKVSKKFSGVLLVAFDNSLSIDVILGEKIDDELVAFSYEDILSGVKDIKEEYKDSSYKIYYPIPEYKFPISLYSDKYLPALDDEEQKMKNLIKIGKFKEYTTSYMLIFSLNDKVDTDVIYVKYNIDRLKKYELSTMIKEKNNKRTVIKKALNKEANEHVENLCSRVNLIENKNIVMSKPIKVVRGSESKDGKSYVEFDYIAGVSLSKYIIDEIKKGEDDIKIIKKYMDLLIGKNSGLIDIYNIDCLFSNAIKKDDKIYVIDGEWIGDDTVEVGFLQYRILKYFYETHKQELRFNSFKHMLNTFLISKEDANRYEEVENVFQRNIHGNIDNRDVLKYYENKSDISSYYYFKNQYDNLKDKLDRIVGGENAMDYLEYKQSEEIRLTNVHVNNLNALISNLKSENAELAKQVNFFHKREASYYKVLRKIKNFAKTALPDETIRKKVIKYIYRTFRHPIKMLKIYFTKNGRNRIVGDFMIGDAYFECGKVAFPYCSEVKVSIVIPCYNQIRWTYKCLYSIMKTVNSKIIPYEVIIADDNSKDTTKNIKKYVENVVVSRNEENLGFLRNCNKAAALARGEYIMFLNNDTEVEEGAIYYLMELLDRDITIGMAGSKLIYPNGVLQEAGGIIWSNGTGANYGRGQDEKDYKFNYIREVDYISGASIMIRKSLWDLIGGFDERYIPAYCEDSDLAFSVRKFGMKVMYQPLSRVIHYEGISNGVDVNDTNSLKSYQIVNTEKLKEKWEQVLINQYPASNTPNFFKARERNLSKKTILFIDHYVPTWDKDAGSKTIFSYMRMFLMKGYIVKFLGDNFILNSPYGDVLQQMGIEVLYGNDLQLNIWEFLKENKRNIDYIFLNRPHVAIKYIDFIKENMNSKILFYGHDLHYLRLNREYELEKDSNTLVEARYFRNLEYSIMYRADMSYYPSNVEIDEIKSVDEKLKVKSINAYIYENISLEKRDFKNTAQLLFVGGFAHEPNVDALRWFDESILPRLKARMNVVLNVVGSNATDEVKEICSKEGYNFIGYVSDSELESLYEKTRIVIAPLRYGAGIKGKIVEAMSKGCAIVTTPCGAEGIEEAEKFMKVEATAQEFAHCIEKLYDNFDELEKLSFFARKEINKHFSMEAAWEKIKDDFDRG